MRRRWELEGQTEPYGLLQQMVVVLLLRQELLHWPRERGVDGEGW